MVETDVFIPEPVECKELVNEDQNSQISMHLIFLLLNLELFGYIVHPTGCHEHLLEHMNVGTS